MAPIAQKHQILKQVTCKRLEDCFKCEVAETRDLSKFDIQRSSMVVVQNILFDTPEILEESKDLRAVVDKLLDSFILEVKEDRILASDTIKTVTQLKIFGTIAGQQHWSLERGGKAMIAEHEGMLAALWKVMLEVETTDPKQVEDLREYRKEVIWVLRNLIRQTWDDKKDKDEDSEGP